MLERSAQQYDLIREAIGKDYATEAAVLTEQIRSRAPGAATLLDVGCGTAGHLQHLAETFEVVGTDLDEGMLAVARERLPDVEFVAADMVHLDLGRTFDAAVCLFSSIGYLQGSAALDDAVTAMTRHLAPGGVLIVDGWVRPELWFDGDVRAVAHTSDGVAVARVNRTERIGNHTVLDMHYLVATAEGIEHLTERHELTLFSHDDYMAAFRAAGLDPETVDGPDPGRDRYIARRAG